MIRRSAYALALIIGPLGLSWYLAAEPFRFLSLEGVGLNEWEVKASHHAGIGIKYREDERDLPAWLRSVVTRVRVAQSQAQGEVLRSWDDVNLNEARYANICSETAKLFWMKLVNLGYKVRIVWAQGHTSTELYLNDNWVIVDSHVNLMIRDTDTGEFLGFDDLVREPTNIEYVKIVEDGLPPEFNYYDMDAQAFVMPNPFANVKTPVVIFDEYVIPYSLASSLERPFDLLTLLLAYLQGRDHGYRLIAD